MLKLRDAPHHGDYPRVVRRHHLPTIRPVQLESVVLLRVVRRGNGNPHLAAQDAHRVAQLGHRAHPIEQIGPYPIGSQRLGARLSETLAVIAAIVGHHRPQLTPIGVHRPHVGCHRLRRRRHGIYIEPIRPYAHQPPHAARAECQPPREALPQAHRVILHEPTYSLPRLRIVVVPQPLLHLLHNIIRNLT